MNDLSATPSLRRRTLFLLTLIAILPIWFGLGSHPLSPRSEGRYASAALAMVQGQGWLIPRLEGHPHLTKPPLTYWLEAACMLAAGVNEWSVRIPSALAGSLTLLIALGLGWKIAGRRVALLTVGLLAVMPLQLIISRLTITDALLNLFWTGALATGYLAVKEPKSLRWPVLLWASVALGLMTKGPLAWVPVGCILVWLLARLGRHAPPSLPTCAACGYNLTGNQSGACPECGVPIPPQTRRRIDDPAAPRSSSPSIASDIKALRLPWGLTLSAIPLALWVAAAIFFDRDAVHVWWHEMVNRIGGESDLHREPLYYFIPVFIGGLFPATAMLSLPGLNYSFKSAWADLRAGRDACLWALAVVLPFVMFSLISGKLASYLVPLCPPLAILTALMLDRWITRQSPECGQPRESDNAQASDPPSPPEAAPSRLPEVVTTFAVVMVIIALAVPLVIATELGRHWLWAAAGPPPLAGVALWLWWSWKNRPARRAGALLVMWLALIAGWLWAFHVQDRLDNSKGDPAMLVAIREKIGPAPPPLVTYGFADATLAFYLQQPAPRVGIDQLGAQLAAHPRDLIVVAEESAWADLEKHDPALTDKFEKILPWKLWTKTEPRIILRAKPDAPPQSAPAPPACDPPLLERFEFKRAAGQTQA